MNTKLFFILLLLLGISEISFGGTLQNKNHTKRRINLSSSSDNKRMHRSVFVLPLRAFSTGSLLSIEQDPSLDLLSYEITVKDAGTDEQIFVQSAVGNADVSIAGLPSGEYTLEIEIGELLLSGNFIIDDCSFGMEE